MEPIDSTFQTLRTLLQAEAAELTVAADSSDRFCLEAAPGPATVAAWGGKMRRSMIPVAWVERGKAYSSYHLMGINGNASLVQRMSPELRARMQGKTCFNFRRPDDVPAPELAAITRESIAGLRRSGFIVQATSPAVPNS